MRRLQTTGHIRKRDTRHKVNITQQSVFHKSILFVVQIQVSTEDSPRICKFFFVKRF